MCVQKYIIFCVIFLFHVLGTRGQSCSAKQMCRNLARSCGAANAECNTACSISGTTPGYGTALSNAIDGVVDSLNYVDVYLTGMDTDAFFQVDLGESMLVSSVYLQGRVTDVPPASGAGVAERSLGNQVYVSNTAHSAGNTLNSADLCGEITSDYLITGDSTSPFPCECRYLPFNCNTPRTGRYVIVFQNGGTHSFQITELEIYRNPLCDGHFISQCPTAAPTCSACSSESPTATLDAGLAHWLRFEDDTALNFDSITGAAVGTLTGPSFTNPSAQIGKGMRFASGEKFSFTATPSTGGLNFGTASWTIAFFTIYEGTPNYNRIMDIETRDASDKLASGNFLIQPADATDATKSLKFAYWDNSNGGFTISTAVANMGGSSDNIYSTTNNVVGHFAFVFTCITTATGCAGTSTLDLYENGNYRIQKTLSAAPKFAESFFLTFGQRATGDGPWTGWIDDLRIYNRALTAAEVATLAGQTSSTPEVSPCTCSSPPVVGLGGCVNECDASRFISTAYTQYRLVAASSATVNLASLSFQGSGGAALTMPEQLWFGDPTPTFAAGGSNCPPPNSITVNGISYKYYAYTTSSTGCDISFAAQTRADILVVGGGGAGYATKLGAGGGGGDVLYFEGVLLDSGTPYEVEVGAGGSGSTQNNGGNSFVRGGDIDIIAGGGGWANDLSSNADGNDGTLVTYTNPLTGLEESSSGGGGGSIASGLDSAGSGNAVSGDSAVTGWNCFGSGGGGSFAAPGEIIYDHSGTDYRVDYGGGDGDTIAITGSAMGYGGGGNGNTWCGSSINVDTTKLNGGYGAATSGSPARAHSGAGGSGFNGKDAGAGGTVIIRIYDGDPT